MKLTPALIRWFAAGISNDVEGVATGGDNCTPPGSGDVGSSTRGCFADLVPRRQSAPPPHPCLVGIDRILAPDTRRAILRTTPAGVPSGSHVAIGRQARSNSPNYDTG